MVGECFCKSKTDARPGCETTNGVCEDAYLHTVGTSVPDANRPRLPIYNWYIFAVLICGFAFITYHNFSKLAIITTFL